MEFPRLSTCAHPRRVADSVELRCRGRSRPFFPSRSRRRAGRIERPVMTVLVCRSYRPRRLFRMTTRAGRSGNPLPSASACGAGDESVVWWGCMGDRHESGESFQPSKTEAHSPRQVGFTGQTCGAEGSAGVSESAAQPIRRGINGCGIRSSSPEPAFRTPLITGPRHFSTSHSPCQKEILPESSPRIRQIGWIFQEGPPSRKVVRYPRIQRQSGCALHCL